MPGRELFAGGKGGAAEDVRDVYGRPRTSAPGELTLSLAAAAAGRPAASSMAVSSSRGRADWCVGVDQRGQQRVQGLPPASREGSLTDAVAVHPVQPPGERFR
jgi:hypothetical protein